MKEAITLELKELIESEFESCKYVRDAIDWLTQFYVYPYFQVAYIDGGMLVGRATPNAATSIIIRIIEDYDILVNDHLDGPKQRWSDLLDKARDAKTRLSKEDISEALPLKAMGILPLFSVCYLAEVLGTTDSPLDNKAYAVAIRRILFSIYCEQNAHSLGINKPDKLHPFLLYRCVKALKKLNEQLKKSSDPQLIKFRKYINDEALILEAIKRRYETQYKTDTEDYLKSIYGIGDWQDFKDYLNKATTNSEFIDKL